MYQVFVRSVPQTATVTVMTNRCVAPPHVLIAPQMLIVPQDRQTKNAILETVFSATAIQIVP